MPHYQTTADLEENITHLRKQQEALKLLLEKTGRPWKVGSPNQYYSVYFRLQVEVYHSGNTWNFAVLALDGERVNVNYRKKFDEIADFAARFMGGDDSDETQY